MYSSFGRLACDRTSSLCLPSSGLSTICSAKMVLDQTLSLVLKAADMTPFILISRGAAFDQNVAW